VNFWDFLKPAAPSKTKAAPKPASAAELGEALAQAEAEAAATEQTAADLARARAAQLLVGTESELDEADRRLQLAQRAADRSAVAVEALRTKLREAEERERRAELDRTFAAGEAALSSGLALYRDYARHAATIVGLVEQMIARQADLGRVNATLRKAGDPRSLPDLDTVARPERSSIPQLRVPVWGQLVLPAGDHSVNRLWPAFVQVDVPPSPVRVRGDSVEPPAAPREPGTVQW
jgi:multidrug efflux pump subunit AcrA (membrane-fusion protein)